MKAIILAGGRGERLKPLTDSTPKPMIEISGKPILEHIISQMKKHGIKDFIIALYYLPKVITSYFGNGSKFGVDIQYTFENSPMGTAGAVKSTEKLIKETFIVTYADILRELDITAMIESHQKRKALATINIYKRKGKNPKSIVVFDKNRRVKKFIERPTTTHCKASYSSSEGAYATESRSSRQARTIGFVTNSRKDLREEFVWVNGSFYIFEPEIFQYIPKNKPSDFGKNIFPKLIKEKELVFVYPSYNYLMDIGSLEKLELARKTFHSKPHKT